MTENNLESEFHSAAVTQSIIEHYYNLDIEPFLSSLAEDAMWIGRGNIFAFGEDAIRKLFVEIYMPKIELLHVEMTEIYRTKELAVVVGQYDAVTDPQAEEITAVHQRATVLWRFLKGRWRILHLHISNEYSELAPNEVYPVKMSHLTYDYMLHLLNKKFIESNKLILEEDNSYYFINPEEILYVEAIKNKCILYLADKTIVTKKPITEMENLLPINFSRIHRSYLVNCNWVASISRFQLELKGGVTLPLPEKRYTAIRDSIREKLSMKGEENDE